MQNFITSKEAVKLFLDAGISESTFRRKVRDNEIETKMPEGRQRGALYSKSQILEIIRQEKKATPTIEHGIGATDWCKESDLPYLLAFDLEMYGIENTVDISITHKWWKKNPNACLVLFNSQDRREVWGGITIMPMEEETILKLLRGDIEERDITADDILAYEPGKQYYGYIASAVVKPEHRASFVKLIWTVFDFWCDNYPDIQIKKLYAYAISDHGYDLIKKLFFSPRYDIGENAYELEPFRRNPSRLLQAFQQCIQEKDNARAQTA